MSILFWLFIFSLMTGDVLGGIVGMILERNPLTRR